MNITFWIKALKVIPRIEKEEWQKLDFISKWLVLTRSAVFVITIIPAIIVAILAYLNNKFNLLDWVMLTIGLVLAHALNNMLNDYTDYIKGVDKDNYFRAKYGPHVLEHGLMSKDEFLKYVVITGILALAVALYFIITKGIVALILVLIGSFFVLFYTYPLKYIGLGEPSVLIVWGPLMIGGGYYVVANEWNLSVILMSFVYSLGATSVLFGKHIDKYHEDKSKGIRTFPVIVGEKNARIINIIIMLLQYILVVYLVMVGFFKFTMLVTLLGLYWFFSRVLLVYLKPKPSERPENYPESAWPLWYVAFAFDHNKKFGYLFILGLFFELLYKLF
ncbi:MAG: prenyltransferase [candidate division WOR-3 bacterium]|nr:prenyltransferase [candidate division WOR-3 bacterium]MCX7947724.1 prenyltransferase [candidate division WOR-3 bacterium]MDW8150353.1 prenyltransferase [candidate division WOR-3 bacterium]